MSKNQPIVFACGEVDPIKACVVINQAVAVLKEHAKNLIAATENAPDVPHIHLDSVRETLTTIETMGRLTPMSLATQSLRTGNISVPKQALETVEVAPQELLEKSPEMQDICDVLEVDITHPEAEKMANGAILSELGKRNPTLEQFDPNIRVTKLPTRQMRYTSERTLYITFRDCVYNAVINADGLTECVFTEAGTVVPGLDEVCFYMTPDDDIDTWIENFNLKYGPDYSMALHSTVSVTSSSRVSMEKPHV